MAPLAVIDEPCRLAVETITTGYRLETGLPFPFLSNYLTLPWTSVPTKPPLT